MITQQKTVFDSRLDCLDAVVTDLLTKGWVSIGGPFRDERKDLWCQSMQLTAGNGDLRLREPKKR